MKNLKTFLIIGVLVLTTVLINHQSLIDLFKHSSTSRSKLTPAPTGGKAYPSTFALSIDSDLPVPLKSKVPFTLTLNVTSREALKDLEINWVIPPEVKILRGVVDQTIAILPRETQKIEIVLELPDGKNYQIFASVSHKNEQNENPQSGGRHGFSTQFVTNPDALDPVHTTVFYPPEQKGSDAASDTSKFHHIAQ